MKTDTSRVSKAYRQIFFAVPLTVIALVALLVIASTNSSLQIGRASCRERV